MKTLNAPDTISGKEGRAYAKINGNNEELFYAKTIEANVEKSKSEIKAIGKRMTGHKTTGANGSGSMTLYYMTPLFREMLRQWKETGKDVYQRSTGRIYRPHNQKVKRKPCPRTDGAFLHIRRNQNEKAQIQTPVLD